MILQASWGQRGGNNSQGQHTPNSNILGKVGGLSMVRAVSLYFTSKDGIQPMSAPVLCLIQCLFLHVIVDG
jgi:hypothetical protein